MDKKYTVHTDLDTLAEVWNLFEEVGAEGLLIGKKLTGDMSEIISFFVGQKKLVEFCRIVTQSDDDFGKMKFLEVGQIIKDFFTEMGAESAGLFSILAVRPQTQKKSETPEKKAKSPDTTSSGNLNIN